MEIKNVTVSGAGLMGTQIAMQAALYGYQVTTYDVFPAQLEKAKAFADDWFAKRVQKGKLTAAEAAAAQLALHYSADIQAAAGGGSDYRRRARYSGYQDQIPEGSGRGCSCTLHLCQQQFLHC